MHVRACVYLWCCLYNMDIRVVCNVIMKDNVINEAMPSNFIGSEKKLKVMNIIHNYCPFYEVAVD